MTLFQQKIDSQKCLFFVPSQSMKIAVVVGFDCVCRSITVDATGFLARSGDAVIV